MLRSALAPLSLALALVSSGCDTESPIPAAPSSAAIPGADQVIEDFRHVSTQEGVRTAEIHGDTAFVHESGRRLDLRRVEMQIYGRDGQRTGQLTARRGEFQPVRRRFVARGDVVLVTNGPKGERRLTTDELHYDAQGDRLWSDRPFVLNEEGRTTRGSSFRSDSHLETWEVTGVHTEGGMDQGETGFSF